MNKLLKNINLPKPKISFFKSRDARVYLMLGLLGALFGVFAIPTINLNLSGLGVDEPFQIQSPKIDVSLGNFEVKNDLILEPAGDLTERRISTFQVQKDIKLQDFDKIVDIVRERISFSRYRDIIVQADRADRQFKIDASSDISEGYINTIATSSGDFEVLKYNEELSQDATTGFFNRANYQSININREDFRRVTRIALDEKSPEDPAAQFSVRVTLEPQAFERFQENSSEFDNLALFDGDELVGFMQTFPNVENRFVISELGGGEQFYSILGRLKAPQIESEISFVDSQSVTSNWDQQSRDIFGLQILIFITLLGALLTLIYKRDGFNAFLLSLVTMLIVLFLMRFNTLLISEYTLTGLLFSVGLVLVFFLMSGLYELKRFEKMDISIFSMLIVSVISFIGVSLTSGIGYTLFIPLIYSSITALIIQLIFGNRLQR